MADDTDDTAMPSNVVTLATAKDENRLLTPELLLMESVNDVRPGGRFSGATRALVLFLDDTEGKYNVSFACANLKGSEAVALMEFGKTKMKKLMGY